MAVYTPLDDADARVLARRWALGEVTGFDGIAKGSVNTNYRLEAASGTFFVRLDETRGRAEMEAEVALLAYLARRGFPTPEPAKDRDGARVGILKGKPVAVFPWMPGADKPAEKYRPLELATAGEMLAKLHHAAKGYGRTLVNRFGRVATAARWSRVRELARIAKSDRAEIDEAVASFSREPSPPGPSGIVHGDWFADNLLFDGGRIVAVLDFEAAATDHLTFDVAAAINALCWLPSAPTRFKPDRVSALLAGYRKGKGPAPIDERTLVYFLRLTALRFTVTRIQDFRMKKASLRVEKDYRDFLKRLRWWSSPRQRGG
jgi:homoserine kinase type II